MFNYVCLIFIAVTLCSSSEDYGGGPERLNLRGYNVLPRNAEQVRVLQEFRDLEPQVSFHGGQIQVDQESEVWVPMDSEQNFITAMQESNMKFSLKFQRIKVKQYREPGNASLSASRRHTLVVGGGPVGLFACLQILLASEENVVTLVESRPTFERPQVIKMPFSPINSLPQPIKDELWDDKDGKIKDFILGPRHKSDRGFWWLSLYKYYTLIRIGNFQQLIHNHISSLTTSGGEKRFNVIYATWTPLDLVKHFEKSENKADLILVATGGGKFTREIRAFLQGLENNGDLQSVPKTEALDTTGLQSKGIIVTYDAASGEDYMRGGQFRTLPIDARYFHSNDKKHSAQIYTYPKRRLEEVFKRMPAGFPEQAKYSSDPSKMVKLDGSGKNLDGVSREWLTTSFVPKFKEIMKTENVTLPGDSHVFVSYAHRGESHYERVDGTYGGRQVLFIGDSAGGTDYYHGLSCSRGLKLVEELGEHFKDMNLEKLVGTYRARWNYVVDTEFGQGWTGEDLKNRPYVVFRYSMEGRLVDGAKVSDRDAFVKEAYKLNAHESSQLNSFQYRMYPYNIRA